MQHSKTILVYALLFCCVSGLGFLSQSVRQTTAGVKVTIKKAPYCLAIALLVIFTALYASGADYLQYKLIFSESDWEAIRDTQIEAGYRILNIVLKWICFGNAVIGVAIIKSLTVIIVGRCFYLLKDKINIGLSLAAYVALAYFISLNLIRIYLASAVVMAGVTAYLISARRKYLKLVIAIFVAATVHYTAIGTMLIPVFFYLRSTFFREETRKDIYIAILLIFMAVLIVGVVPVLVRSISVLNKYQGYLKENTSFGIGQIVYFSVPVFWLFITRNKMENMLWGQAFVMIAIAFAISMMGYVIGMMSRLSAFFDIAYYLGVSQLVNGFGKYAVQIGREQMTNYRVLTFMTTTYFAVRLAIYLTGGALIADGIQELIFIWEI